MLKGNEYEIESGTWCGRPQRKKNTMIILLEQTKQIFMTCESGEHKDKIFHDHMSRRKSSLS